MPRHNPQHHKSHHRSKSGSIPEPQLAGGIRSDPSIIHLDGRTLEGGGQLVRVALTLSALTSIPIRIYNIRGNRSGKSSGRAGGLKSSHLAALEFLGHATAAKTYGAYVGSTEMVFEPGRDRQSRKGTGREQRQQVGCNDDDHKMYEIRLDKPGSVWLILQAILPYIIFAASENVPTRLLVTGGTNVPKSMSGEYVTQVMCPMFAKIGLPKIEVDIRTRGWTTGRAIQIGEVDIKLHPLSRGTKLPSFSLQNRGPISKIAISVIAGTEAMRSALVSHTTQLLRTRYLTLPQPEFEVAVNDDSGDLKRIYILLVAHSSNGYRLGRDWLYDRKIKDARNEEQMDSIARKMAQTVVDELNVEISHGGCVDDYMRDQLVVFEAIADGRSYIDGGVETGDGSLHAKTCRWVAEQILVGRARFDPKGGCTGIGFSAGEVYEKRSGVEGMILRMNEEDDVEKKDDAGRGDRGVEDGLVEKLRDLGLEAT